MSPRPRQILLYLSGLFSLVLNVVCQFKMFAGKTHIQRPPVYSVHPFFLYAAIAGQAALQLRWLWFSYSASTLFTAACHVKNASEVIECPIDSDQGPTQASAVSEMPMLYIPVYNSGNLCIAMWTAACQTQQYSLAQILLLTNIVAQVYVVFFMLRDDQEQQNKPTMLIAKVFLGTSVLYLWHTWGMIDISVEPTGMQRLQTEAVFLLLTIGSGPDPTLGLVLVYTLIGLFFGRHQNPIWHSFFLYSAASIASTLVLDFVCTRWRLNKETPTCNRASQNTHAPSNDNEGSVFLHSVAGKMQEK